MDVENTMDVADYYAREMLFYRKNMTSFPKLLEKFMTPTAEDVMRIAQKMFDWRQMKLVIIGDYSINGQKMVQNIMRIIKETYAK